MTQTPAGWMTDPTGRHQLRHWDGSQWTAHISNNGVPGTDALPQAAPRTAQPLRPDGGFVHFLRYLLIGLVMGLLCYVIVGLVWFAFALSATGRRKRDILMFFIPIWGSVVSVQTIWRYTAKNVYWSVRSDRISKSLFST